MSGKLMRAMQWAKREFSSDSVPNRATVKKWVERGVIQGRIIDGAVYVFDTERAGLKSEVSAAVKELLRA